MLKIDPRNPRQRLPDIGVNFKDACSGPEAPTIRFGQSYLNTSGPLKNEGRKQTPKSRFALENFSYPEKESPSTVCATSVSMGLVGLTLVIKFFHAKLPAENC